MSVQLIRTGFEVACTRVDNECEYLRELETNPPELILADYSMPDFGALAQGPRLERARSRLGWLEHRKLNGYDLRSETWSQIVVGDSVKANAEKKACFT